MQACLPPEIPRWYDAENKHSTGRRRCLGTTSAIILSWLRAILHEWARAFPIDRGPGASLRALVRWLADELDRPGSALNDSPRAVAHIEKAIRRFPGSDLDFEANLHDLCGRHTEISGW